MITELRIRNYKSILDTTMELSNVNVFIGENGCGKTNILEAVGMLSARMKGSTGITMLTSKGIRVTRPSLTLSSFLYQKKSSEFSIYYISTDFSIEDFSFIPPIYEMIYDNKVYGGAIFYPTDINDIYTEWDGGKDNKQHFIREGYKDEVNDAFLQVYENLKKAIPIKINDGTKREQYNSELSPSIKYIKPYLIFNLNTQALRGISTESKEVPLGIYGEGLDVLLNDFSKEEWEILKRYTYLIDWLDDIVIDKSDKLKYEGHKLGRSNSVLYFRDKFMAKKNNVFAAENSNEGILHILFYLALVISKKTPRFFAIDNIEASLNPKLCRVLMKILAELAIERDKQILITTHNPAILDGLNLNDDRQRLNIVKRSDEGYTQTERIHMKPDTNGQQLKLSELWMRGYLGGLPTNF
jgi:AAA15 family ATPase/GTPase